MLSQSRRGGSITINIAAFNADLWFTPASTYSLEGYRYLRLEVPSWEFVDIKGDPMRVELFAAQWVHLCEALKAQAAYFDSHNAGKSEDIARKCIKHLRQSAFWEFTCTRYWRTYLNPSAAAHWFEQNHLVETPWTDRLETLPSGALVLWSDDSYNPEPGDDDALLNARFLLEQIGQRADMPGARTLLDLLRLEEKRLLRIEDDKDYVKHGDAAFYDYDGLRASRTILDEVRATWACALQRPGLVGVQQTFPGTAGEPEVTVPVVAEGGQEWLLATLLYPFDLNATAWHDPATGLRARVAQLLHAAQEQTNNGEPPRVVVYCWRGISSAVREALHTMGAGVEIADSLPLLG